jgi:hypothetical protein
MRASIGSLMAHIDVSRRGSRSPFIIGSKKKLFVYAPSSTAVAIQLGFKGGWGSDSTAPLHPGNFVTQTMSDHITYVPSKLLGGETELIRQHSFTRWMSADLLQAATDFCRNIGLGAIYSECSRESGFRYLMWRAPKDAHIEIRSGRSRQKFEEIDLRNAANNRPLLSLHIDEKEIYSAVWISAEHYETAKAMLAVYGITPAERKAAG